MNARALCWIRIVALGVCAALSSLAQAAQVEASGQVRVHQSGQWGEAVPGVLVSNGRELVRTDSEGRYRIAVTPGQTVFVIKPPGWREVVDAGGEARHWRHHFPTGSPALRHGGIASTGTATSGWDFGLVPEPAATDHLDMLVFGDPQPNSMRQVDYFQRDIIAPLLDRADAAPPGSAQSVFAGRPAQLGITLGDIVNDDLSLYPAMRAAHARLGLPWLYVAGNHDLDFDAASDADSLLTFRRHFGPDTFAWETAQASLIVLDNVVYLPGQSPEYIGGLREEQLEFLRAYLDTLAPGRRLLIAAHIPFHDEPQRREGFRRADRERLFALLARFPDTLLLTAHTHTQRHYRHRQADGWRGQAPLHEYNVGTSNGGFWGGLEDAEGIPDAVMMDGTPNGFARVSMPMTGDYALSWEVARQPDHPGLALHAPRVLRRGAYPGVGLFANVFMGEVGSRVEYRIDGGDWLPMTHVMRADPRVLAINLADDAAPTLRARDRTPEASVSWHLWRTSLRTDLAPGEHEVEVRAQDRWRGELRATTRYQLIEHSP